MGKSTFELINETIIAVSHLLWPILIFVIVLIFRKQLIILLTRLKKGKLWGQEFELGEKVNTFERNVKEAGKEIPEINIKDSTATDKVDILAGSAKDPKIGIMILSREIEKEVRMLLASLGLIDDKNYTRINQAFEILEQRGSLPKNATESVKTFWQLRNEIVHGKEIKNENNIIRVLDIGITLLRMLRAIPHEKNIVYNPGVDIYSDANCTKKIDGVKGLILETSSPGGSEKTHRIFPTTKSNYTKGKQVAWEWNLFNIWAQAWYIVPGTNDKKSAWIGSGEFVGRHIDEL